MRKKNKMKQINYTLLLIFGLIIFFFTDCRTQKKIEEGYTGTTTTGLPITSKDYLQKGNVEMDKKNYKEALENLNKAIELDEENGEEEQEWPETPDFSDIPFEIKRPPKDAPDPTQMTLF